MEQESRVKPVVRVYNVRWVKSLPDVIAMNENVLKHGATEFHARQLTVDGEKIWRVEWYVPREDAND